MIALMLILPVYIGLRTTYVDLEDSALIVLNIHGFGWTINMANPRGKIIVAATIAIPVIEIILIFPIIRQ